MLVNIKLLQIGVVVASALLSSSVFSEDEKPWEPTATEFDWVQLTSNEWLKGEIKGMYNENLVFDSDKLDLLEIDIEDVLYLKSFRPAQVNLETLGTVTGKLKISDENISITTEGNTNTYDRIELISFAPAANREIDRWTADITLGLNLKTGNTEQYDYSAQVTLKRRTAESRFAFDYIGNISKTDAVSGTLEETVNSHHTTATMDIYATRYFFYTPFNAEYFHDPFQNIKRRMTLGAGIGYTLYDEKTFEWNVNTGPAVVQTTFVSVLPGEDEELRNGAWELGTDFDIELSSTMDYVLKYNLRASDSDSGGFTHHLNTSITDEITKKLDIDISFIWDRISDPQRDEFGNLPEEDDFRLLFGLKFTH